MILYYTFHTFGFKEIFDAMSSGQLPMGSEAWLTAAGILIFCGAIGKSAQFPLHVWLPDAMELSDTGFRAYSCCYDGRGRRLSHCTNVSNDDSRCVDSHCIHRNNYRIYFCNHCCCTKMILKKFLHILQCRNLVLWLSGLVSAPYTAGFFIL